MNCFSRKKTYSPGTEEEDGHRRSIRGKGNLKKERKKEARTVLVVGSAYLSPKLDLVIWAGNGGQLLEPISPSKNKSIPRIRKQKPPTEGFEPAQEKPNRYRVRLLNHSDISTGERGLLKILFKL